MLACAPLLITTTAAHLGRAAATLLLAAAVSSVLGLLIAAPLRSIENYAGIINVVLFPLLFLSGALYPTSQMPAGLRVLARTNPVSYAVDLMRGALGQPTEFGASLSLVVLALSAVIAFAMASILFDPERRISLRNKRAAG